MKTLILATIIATLAGCALNGPPKPPETVRVPVLVRCLDGLPARPSFLSDEQLLALDNYGVIVALAQDRRLRQAYELQLEALLAGCR
jgi:hypothetical protein